MAQARRDWRTEAAQGVGGISPERLVFLDECGALTDMVRLYGRSPRGTRACASAPFGHWTRLTVLGALGDQGIVGAMGVERCQRRKQMGASRRSKSGARSVAVQDCRAAAPLSSAEG